MVTPLHGRQRPQRAQVMDGADRGRPAGEDDDPVRQADALGDVVGDQQSPFALPAVMAMTIWKDFGYAVILFMSGLMSVPSDYYEAAHIDGANAWKTFCYITLPLLKPTMIFVVITSVISYLQAYVPVMVMTDGGPGTATFLSSYLVYDQAFVKYNFGYASAIAFFILVLTAILTVISFTVTGEKPEKRRKRA